MHELSITQNIVAIVAERAGARPVRRVKLQLGRLAGVDAQAIRFCFDVCAHGTVLESAILEIEEIEGVGRCPSCHREVPLQQPAGRCQCEARAPLEVLAGVELLIKEMET